MRSRALRILMLAFISLWFGVIVPGHQRGIIQLPGSCCALKPPCCGPANSSHKPNSPTPPDGGEGNCAICYTFTCTLQLPTPILLTLPPVSVIAELSPPALQSLTGLPHLISPRGRGPPATA